MKFSILCFALLLSTTLGAKAGFIEAEKAFEDHRYTDARREFEQEARNKNDYRAKFYLAKIYLDGLGVSPNPKKGLDYLNESANQGYDVAQALLAYMYEKGEVVPMNKQKAITLYQQAAEQNNSSAKFNLGLAFFKGEAVPKDTKQAITLLQEVDVREIPQVGRYLGNMYMSENRIAEAIPAYTQSARQGDVEAFYSLGNLYMAGHETSKAIEYYTYAASMGNAPAQNMLGSLYVNGQAVSRNIPLGHAWLKVASDQGYEPAVDIKNQVAGDMSRSETEQARREFLKLQNDVLGKIASPYIAEARIEAERVAKEEAENKAPKGKTIRRRR